MSRAGGYTPPGTSGSGESGGLHSPLPGGIVSQPGSVVVNYKMRGKNTTNVIVVWVVQGAPDLTGAQYTGPNTPITGITIAASW